MELSIHGDDYARALTHVARRYVAQSIRIVDGNTVTLRSRDPRRDEDTDALLALVVATFEADADEVRRDLDLYIEAEW